MSTLQVLLPPLARFAGAPAFQRWLARGERLQDMPDARETTVRDLFRLGDAPIPVAALRHHAHVDAARAGTLLCADPAYVRSEATGARLLAWPIADLTAPEACALVDELQPLFTDAGLPLQMDTPATWHLRASAETALAGMVTPADALGADLLECLPTGEAGRPWRRLFNEVQIALHAHPVNAARSAASKLPVNALWFWGGGALPDSVATRLQQVASADDMLRGLAKLAGAVRLEPLPEIFSDADQRGDALLDLGVFGSGESIATWHAAFERLLRTRRFRELTLTFASGERWRVTRAHRLRFWRHG